MVTIVSKGEPSRPVCSVCIANYNGQDVLTECIDSVLEQQGDFIIELIVHDDASTDRALEEIDQRYPEIQVIRSRENVGYCIANRRMVEEARGQYVLLLNNDAKLFPDAILSFLTEARRNPIPAILGLPQYSTDSHILTDRGFLLDPFLNPIPLMEESSSTIGFVSGACLWLPRSLWHELGGFPEPFEYLAEDLWLCSIARLWGYGVKVLPESGFFHHVGWSLGGGGVAKRLQSTYRRRRLTERNKIFVMFCCYPTVAMWGMILCHLVLLLVEGVILAFLLGRVSLLKNVYGSAIIGSMRHIRQLFYWRRQIQAGRRISLVQWLQPFRPIPQKLYLLITRGLPTVGH